MTDDPEFELFVKTYQAIARRTPAIWDVLGRVSLNPQPLPPIADDPLNPQPLPPGPPPETYGAYAGRELVKLFWAADKLGTQVVPKGLKELFPGVAAGDEKELTLPPWLPQPPRNEVDDAWRASFYLGLLCALAMDENATVTSRTKALAQDASDALVDILKHPTRPHHLEQS